MRYHVFYQYVSFAFLLQVYWCFAFHITVWIGRRELSGLLTLCKLWKLFLLQLSRNFFSSYPRSCSCPALWSFTLPIHRLISSQRLTWAILQISRYLPLHNSFLSEICLKASRLSVCSNCILTPVRLSGSVCGPSPSAAFWKLLLTQSLSDVSFLPEITVRVACFVMSENSCFCILLSF